MVVSTLVYMTLTLYVPSLISVRKTGRFLANLFCVYNCITDVAAGSVFYLLALRREGRITRRFNNSRNSQLSLSFIGYVIMYSTSNVTGKSYDLPAVMVVLDSLTYHYNYMICELGR